MGLEPAPLSVIDDKWTVLVRRIKRPCRQWTFYVVMIIGILFVGYLSVWIELKNVKSPYLPETLASLSLAYATAILAVVAPSAMQLILTSNRMVVLAGFVLAVISVTCAYNVSNPPINLYSVNSYGMIGLLLATFSWWLANGDDDLFQDKITRNSATGGDAMRDLSGTDRGVRL